MPNSFPRRLAALTLGALAVLLCAGCAGMSETFAEARLERTDRQVRPLIPPAEDDAEEAIGAFRSADFLLKTEQLPPGAVRPTEEEVKKLAEVAVIQVARYNALVNGQCDRYLKFLDKYPGNWRQRHHFAWFLADNHMEYEAAQQWEAVIEQAPGFPYAYNNLGSLYNHMGRDLEAVLLYRKAIELKPDDPGFHLNLAVNYSTHRKEVAAEFGWSLPRVFRECVLSYQRARALSPKDKAIAYDLASQYVLAKRFDVTDAADDAIAAWEYYLALDLTPQERGYAERNMSVIYLREKNDPAAARRLLEEALSLVPNDAACKILLEQCDAAEKKRAP